MYNIMQSTNILYSCFLSIIYCSQEIKKHSFSTFRLLSFSKNIHHTIHNRNFYILYFNLSNQNHCNPPEERFIITIITYN